MKGGIFLLIVSFCIALLDWYISKSIISNCVSNTGIAFGIQLGYMELFFVFITLILLFLTLYSKGIFRYILISILILGVANFLSRAVYGYVCDYLSLLGISFNIVDIGIVLFTIAGILICMFNMYGDNNRR